ncbi:prolyl oligopeptidase family serine peptidase [Chitinophaga niabensis]|uniref:prolyl oligopeptidase n=1 Tax=Chitinophaga niabensis TaxID=536979 RepID=A0A1N6K357_9BACT|nr:prolyl oligopeptidase family serine peptidase [Chitinophaga niabensis]SIO50999.1 prolyl oligopeptidase [Chitinophaga niabensis]
MMKRFFIVVAWVLPCAVVSAQYKYPATKQVAVTDNYFGTTIADPYRWLEDMGHAETQQWFKAQGALTHQWLDSITGRAALREEILQLYNLSRPGRLTSNAEIYERSNRFFYKKENPELPVPVICYRDGRNGTEKLLVDPGTFSMGKSIEVTFFLPSDDGKKLAFGLCENGKELSAIRIIEVETQKLFPEVLYPSWFGISRWTNDNKGFLYTRNISDNVNDSNMLLHTKVFYHTIGTDESRDREIFSKATAPGIDLEPRDILWMDISDDNRYMIAYAGSVLDEFKSFIAPVSEMFKSQIHWKQVTKIEDGIKSIHLKGDQIFFLSHQNADNFRVMQTSVTIPDVQHAKVIIPENTQPLEKVSMSKDHLLLTYSDGVNNTLRRYDIASGKLSAIPLPLKGTINVTLTNPLRNDCIVEISSWVMPPTKFDIDEQVRLSRSSFETGTPIPGSEDIIVEEVNAEGHDGVLIPLSIFYRKDVRKNGTAPCLVSGYGSYGISTRPFFHPAFIAMVNKGMVVAIAHVRGGGEKGNTWRQAGFKNTKPNTWKDLISCTEYLIDKKYTSSKRIAAHGASAGGITVGRAITERPDLFAAGISEVGLNNMLRAELAPNGPNNAREFGTIKDSTEYLGLLEMDSYHHVKKGVAYPAVLTTVGMNDPRVAAWETAKFAAALQQSSTSGKPVLLSVNYRAGHRTEDKVIAAERYTDVIAFALWQCGHPDFKLKGSLGHP